MLIARRVELLAAAALLAVPSSLWAQAAPPPQPTTAGRAWSNAIGYVLIFTMLVIVVFVSLIPSKRGHQD